MTASPIFPPVSGKIALQFSGGKDSLAVAHLLREHWGRLTFYHLDTGDLLPEVEDIVDDIEAIVPDFRRIETNPATWQAEHGLPSDLVPTTCTPFGLMIGAARQPIVDRFACCVANLMQPIHERMVADGIKLVIRGTKRCDLAKLPAEDGPTGLGYDLWQPLMDWSHERVFAYLREVGAPICRVYDSVTNSPECATCPAWWSEGRSAYLKQHHPGLHSIYSDKLTRVAGEVLPMLQNLRVEMAGA